VAEQAVVRVGVERVVGRAVVRVGAVRVVVRAAVRAVREDLVVVGWGQSRCSTSSSVSWASQPRLLQETRLPTQLLKWRQTPH